MEPLRQVHSFPTKWSKQPLHQVQHYQQKKMESNLKFITQPFHQVEYSQRRKKNSKLKWSAQPLHQLLHSQPKTAQKWIKI